MCSTLNAIRFPSRDMLSVLTRGTYDFLTPGFCEDVCSGSGCRGSGKSSRRRSRNRSSAQAHTCSQNQSQSGSNKRPIIICAHNGLNYLDEGFAILKSGGDTLDAALRVVKGPEDDPNDTSVGLGGIPNEEGVVELDACCMHGPTRRAGSVGGVRNIKNVSLVSKAVMEHTGHVMLVGEGAERFAVAMGFPRENLLTDTRGKSGCCGRNTTRTKTGGDRGWLIRTGRRRRKSLQASRNRIYGKSGTAGLKNTQPVWASLRSRRRDAIQKVLFPPTGTIHCSALNEKGEISGCTTTSGLGYKLPGRCGDSPIIGAGCYTDQDIGSAGATGKRRRKH